MTTIRYDPTAPEMRFEGHAMSGEWGRDLVCAAVSILLHTLAATPGAASEIAPGRARVRGGERAAYETVARGLGLLARSWPQHVKLEETPCSTMYSAP